MLIFEIIGAIGVVLLLAALIPDARPDGYTLLLRRQSLHYPWAEPAFIEEKLS